MTEKETCDGCGAEFEKGVLARDQNGDASQLRCNSCIKPEKKARKPRKRKETPVIAAATPPPVMKPEPEPPPIDPNIIKKDVLAWAQECGLGEVNVNGPDRENYSKKGFGYIVTVSETNGKGRRATARYTALGARNMWTLDTYTTG